MESSTKKEAYEEIERLSQNPETQRLAEFRERELKDIRQQLYDAREDGIEHEKRAIVIKMYGNDFSLNDITQITGVPLVKINEIINAIKQ